MAINFLDGITVDGNVGIGTTSPSQKLEVIGGTKITQSGIALYINSSDTNGSYVTWENNGTDIGYIGAGYHLWSSPNNIATSLGIRANTRLDLGIQSSVDMTILSSGNVGIGTTSPAVKLDISDAVNQTSIRVTNNNYNNYLIQKRRSDNSQILGIQEFGSNGGLSLVTGSSQRLNVNNLGNVGIGTTAPAQKLDVQGNIRVTGVGNALQLDSLGSGGSGGIATINNYETAVYTGRGSAGFGVFGNTTIRLGFGDKTTTSNAGMLINTSDQVGIGTTSPAAKLDVNGDTIVRGFVRSTGGGDGGFVLRQWTYASSYASLATNGMSGLEYCMISDGTDTFLGAGTGGALRLRGPANDSSPQIELNGSLCKVDTGDFKVEDGSIAVGTITNSTTNGRIDASNDIVAFSTSDIRLKDNIKSIDKALDKVNKIQGIEFDWVEKEEVHGNSGRDIGVIAQEIEKVLPDVVTTRDNGYKAVKYEKIVPLLIEAIKDLSKQVDGLKRLI